MKWYCIDKIGMATLCTSKKDAEATAENADMQWPHNGPHRAVQMAPMSKAGLVVPMLGTMRSVMWEEGSIPNANTELWIEE